ncbi:hypothetical protein GCM10023165_38970 [Variovorax defluvii]|uniref:Uncharacterized protein n=1 Tax=Variovorax defluvii TaxID=913761 RepID=A0ABP8I4Q9_9BURK
MNDAKVYAPQDQLTLWMLTDPGRPTRVGELSLASGGQGVGFRYGDAWRAAGYALSEDLR